MIKYIDKISKALIDSYISHDEHTLIIHEIYEIYMKHTLIIY